MNQTPAALKELHPKCRLVRLYAHHPAPKSVRIYFIDLSAFDDRRKQHNAHHWKVSHATNYVQQTIYLYDEHTFYSLN